MAVDRDFRPALTVPGATRSRVNLANSLIGPAAGNLPKLWVRYVVSGMAPILLGHRQALSTADRPAFNDEPMALSGVARAYRCAGHSHARRFRKVGVARTIVSVIQLEGHLGGNCLP